MEVFIPPRMHWEIYQVPEKVLILDLAGPSSTSSASDCHANVNF